jgi:transcriptional regulator GlxA family with amidase domain
MQEMVLAGLPCKLYFLPMAKRLAKVLIVVIDGAQTLDVTGPAEVFALAGREGAKYPYFVRFVASSAGTATTTSGAVIQTSAFGQPHKGDTIIVSGGPREAVLAAVSDRNLARFLLRAHAAGARVASVCSGAFVLAAAGLLDGLRAATHWSAVDRLSEFRPQVDVDKNAIFVQQGKIWTSAGVTTGIDMALAMVEQDNGADVANKIAGQLVLYVRRPGFQSQWSEPLTAQLEEPDPFALVARRARPHLKRLDVPSLARLAGMSIRTMHRRCEERLHTTPARFLSRLRVEHARTLLTTSRYDVKRIAIESGFGNTDRMRRTFVRELGIKPSEVRLLFEKRAR